MMMNNPAHAGELVSEWLDVLKEEGQAITVTELAENIQYTRVKISRIIKSKTKIKAEVALRSYYALAISSDMLSRVQSRHSYWMESQKEHPKIQTFFVNY